MYDFLGYKYNYLSKIRVIKSLLESKHIEDTSSLH